MSDRLTRWRKRPVTVEMISWDGTDEALNLIRLHEQAPGDFEAEVLSGGSLNIWVFKSRAILNLRRGDWAAVERDGSGVYPVTAGEHRDTYEPLDDAHCTVTVPVHSLRILLRFVRPAADSEALTATQLSAYERLAAAAGVE